MSDVQQPSPLARSKPAILVRRLGSSVALWAIVIWTLFSGNKLISDYVFLAIMMAIAGLGLAEFYDLVGRRQLACFKRWGIFGGLLLMSSTFVYVSGAFRSQLHPANDFETSVLIIFVQVCAFANWWPATTTGLTAISTTLTG